jgi:hypothetical protein
MILLRVKGICSTRNYATQYYVLFLADTDRSNHLHESKGGIA